MPLQPLLHDLVTCVSAPTTVLSRADGQVASSGAQGAFHADVRVLSAARLLLDGLEPEAVLASLDGSSAARFTSLARWLGDRGADPSVRVERQRRAEAAGAARAHRRHVDRRRPVEQLGTLDLEVDFAADRRRQGGRRIRCCCGRRCPRRQSQSGAPPAGVAVAVVVDAGEAALHAVGGGVRLSWPLGLAPGTSYELGWRLTVSDPAAVVSLRPRAAPWSRPEVRADDRRLDRLVDQAHGRPRGLRLAAAVAARTTSSSPPGAPWFLTLFGRDAIWAARMLLPLGTDLAAGTLRALARRQGTVVDPASAQQPGKIMHELRAAGLTTPGDRRPCCRRSTTAPSTRPRCGSRCCTTRGAGACPTTRSSALLPALEAALDWLHRPRRRGRRRLPRVRRHAPATGWPTRAGRTPATRSSSATAARRRADRAVRGAGLRVRGRRGGGRRCSTRSAAPAPSACRDWAAALASGSAAAFWVDDAGGRYPGDRPRRRRQARSTRSPATSATCSAPASSTRARSAASSPGSAAPTWTAATACARCRRTRPASTRSATTAARSGRTTPRSRSSGLARDGRDRRPQPR